MLMFCFCDKPLLQRCRAWKLAQVRSVWQLEKPTELRESKRVSEWNHMREHDSEFNPTMQLAAQTATRELWTVNNLRSLISERSISAFNPSIRCLSVPTLRGWPRHVAWACGSARAFCDCDKVCARGASLQASLRKLCMGKFSPHTVLLLQPQLTRACILDSRCSHTYPMHNKT